MKRVFLHACIIGLITLTACGGNTPVQDPNNVSLAAPAPAAAATVDTAQQAAGAFSQPALPSVPAQANAATATAGLNPEHGKPGHRCDIAVGAPLNSPVQQVQQPAAGNPVLPAQPSQSLPATNAAGARLNPAHGQPGHDCAVQVGQPLPNT